jgi:hypothetical protein
MYRFNGGQQHVSHGLFHVMSYERFERRFTRNLTGKILRLSLRDHHLRENH